jgi:hypothetical protein
MKEFFLFYSNKCEHSKMLINIINTSNELVERIEFICVDVNLGKRNPLVRLNNIKEVPTLIAGKDKGSEITEAQQKKRMFVGSSAFGSIEKILSSNEAELGQGQGQGPVSKRDNEIQGYSATYSGLSDSFSTYGEEKPNPLERSFTFLTDKPADMISGGGKTEPSKKLVNNQFERLLEDRAKLDADQKRV